MSALINIANKLKKKRILKYFLHWAKKEEPKEEPKAKES